MPMGITKLQKGREGTVILGCEVEKGIVELKNTMQFKLGKSYNVSGSL